MPNYLRAFVPGGCWFFTVNLLERRQTLLVDHIATLREAVARTRQRLPWTIDAFVVLPDHLHAVWTLPPGDADFSTRWRLIKSRFARALPMRERLSSVRIARSERGIWQRRFWEHLIRDEADYARHVEYCYINPVKHHWSRASAIGRTRRFIAMSTRELSLWIGRARLSRTATLGSAEKAMCRGRGFWRSRNPSLREKMADYASLIRPTGYGLTKRAFNPETVGRSHPHPNCRP